MLQQTKNRRLCGHVLHTAPDVYELVRYQPKTDAPERYIRMRESAGLFAHAECHERALALGERQRMQHVARAIESIPGNVPAGGDVNQMAMYDFEAAQWRFVPIGVFAASADEREEA